MKNRRNVLIAFLLCATLIVGVGYAAIADVMDVFGTAEFNSEDTFDGNVIFTDDIEIFNEYDTANINPNNRDKASFTVKSIATTGDKARFTFTIANQNSQDAYIVFRGFTLNGDAEKYYSVEAVISDGTNSVTNVHVAGATRGSENLDTTTGVRIGGNGTATLTITVTLSQTPDSAALALGAVNATFDVEIFAMDKDAYDTLNPTPNN